MLEASDSFTSTYLGWDNGTSSCSQSYGVIGREPSAPGTYPVFVYVPGTFQPYNGSEAVLFLEEMARRGFVSVSVNYLNLPFFCPDLLQRGGCVFNSAQSQSAISGVCQRAKADCSRGIVVSGLSQGAMIATLAKNFDSRVRAAYGLANGNNILGANYAGCMNPSNRTLSSESLRVVNGESDEFFGTTQNGVRQQLQAITGLSCGATATTCLRSNGSGWMIVLDSQAGDGRADHCYHHGGGGCSGAPAFESDWRTSSSLAWAMETNLTWLANQATQAVSSSSSTAAAVNLIVYPNPWRADRHSGQEVSFGNLTDQSSVKIFDLGGRWLRTLTASGTVVRWDLRNDAGELAASGLYLYLVTDPEGNVFRGKLTLIK